jgi:hypothetical protein
MATKKKWLVGRAVKKRAVRKRVAAKRAASKRRCSPARRRLQGAKALAKSRQLRAAAGSTERAKSGRRETPVEFEAEKEPRG